MNHSLRVYADTSVFGGVFDPEFAAPSKAFFDLAREGRIEVAVSGIVLDEIAGAPNEVVALFEELEPTLIPLVISDEANALRNAYLKAAVVGNRWRADALHVALASVNSCRAIVSWNFKHIVNFRRIPLYNGVNLAQGYGPIAIHTPSELRFDEED